MGERLVHQARLLPADPQLDEHEAGAIHRGLGIRGEPQPAVPLHPKEHAPGEPPDDREAIGIDVVQDELGDRESVAAGGQALDELGRVRAPAADDRDLHARMSRTSS